MLTRLKDWAMRRLFLPLFAAVAWRMPRRYYPSTARSFGEGMAHQLRTARQRADWTEEKDDEVMQLLEQDVFPSFPPALVQQARFHLDRALQGGAKL